MLFVYIVHRYVRTIRMCVYTNVYIACRSAPHRHHAWWWQHQTCSWKLLTCLNYQAKQLQGIITSDINTWPHYIPGDKSNSDNHASDITGINLFTINQLAKWYPSSGPTIPFSSTQLLDPDVKGAKEKSWELEKEALFMANGCEMVYYPTIFVDGCWFLLAVLFGYLLILTILSHHDLRHHQLRLTILNVGHQHSQPLGISQVGGPPKWMVFDYEWLKNWMIWGTPSC